MKNFLAMWWVGWISMVVAIASLFWAIGETIISNSDVGPTPDVVRLGVAWGLFAFSMVLFCIIDFFYIHKCWSHKGTFCCCEPLD